MTTWTVTPEGSACQVRIATTWQGAGGVGGVFERLFAPRVLRRLYDDELSRLDAYARERQRRPGMTGPDGPRVYVSADMEGITGLVDAQDVQPGGADYERGRMMMTQDVNAAIDGIHAAWGERTGVTVNDAHGPMRNILPELLHPAARLIRGKPKPMGMLAGLDGSS